MGRSGAVGWAPAPLHQPSCLPQAGRGARSWRDPGLEVLRARRSQSQGAKERLGPRVASYTRGAGPHPAHLWPQPHIPPKRGKPQAFTGGPDSSALGPSLPHPSYRGDEARRSFWANSTYFSSLSPERSPGEVGGVLGAHVSREEGPQGYTLSRRGLAPFTWPAVHLGSPAVGGAVLTPTPG